jgi:RimJ/RimL family protein N-acetyltransferase
VPSAQGKGYATEAVRAALLIAASNGAQRVKADTLPVNVASQNVMVKAGFLEQHRTDATVYYAFEIDRELSAPRLATQVPAR